MFAREDKYEQQLVKTGITAQPVMRLAFVLAIFQASGKYDAAIQDWEAKPVADKTFTNVCMFIQRKFTVCIKHNKTTAKLGGKGIANHFKEPSKADQAAWVLAEVASVMQTA